jgi:hypothetical protein
MIEVKFTVASAQELQGCIVHMAQMVSGGQTLAPVRQEREGLALYSDEELVEETIRRANPTDPAAASPATAPEAPKARAGRPRKLQAVALAPLPGATSEAANEPAPQPAAVAAAKPAEPSTENALAPEPLTEDMMLRLMQELYAECGDATMVRQLAQQVCGKPQLSEVRPELYPQLKKLIEAELARVRAEKKASAA